MLCVSIHTICDDLKTRKPEMYFLLISYLGPSPLSYFNGCEFTTTFDGNYFNKISIGSIVLIKPFGTGFESRCPSFFFWSKFNRVCLGSIPDQAFLPWVRIPVGGPMFDSRSSLFFHKV